MSDKKQRPPKKIILLSDGTGNSSHSSFKTNVWRLYQALDLNRSETKIDGKDDPTQPDQIAYYDDGVGTESTQLWALPGLAFGYGLKRNVLDLYTFLCRNYQPGDEIYCFGFSRGAFTVRVLADLIADQGLIPVKLKDEEGGEQETSEADLQRFARAAFRANRWHYHKDRSSLNPFNWLGKLLRGLRDGGVRALDALWGRKHYSQISKHDTRIKFVGVWDTVAAYGLPIDELTRAWDCIFPISFPDQNLSPKVERACHALALDDERHSFHPELWDEDSERAQKIEDEYRKKDSDMQLQPLKERLVQVWFAGMHSDVGGGYPDNAMSFVPLNWMMEQATAAGLRFQADARKAIAAAAILRGPIHDSRRGTGGFYRYQPRKLTGLLDDQEAGVKIHLPKIHVSVFERIKDGIDSYAPIVLPVQYEVYPTATRPESTAQAENRARLQEQVWDLVWWKRVVYFATVAVGALLAAFPLWRPPQSACAGPACGVAPFIEAAGAFLPGLTEPWIKAFQTQPGSFLSLLLAMLWLMARSNHYQRCIFDTMRSVWMPLLTVAKPLQTQVPDAHEQSEFLTMKKQRQTEAVAVTWKLRAILAALGLWVVCITGFTYRHWGASASNQGVFDRVTAQLAAPWLQRPYWSVGGLVLLATLLVFKARFQQRLAAVRRDVWRPLLIQPTLDNERMASPNNAIYRLRTNGVYQSVMRGLKKWVMPWLAAGVLVTGTAHFLFSMLERTGCVCHETGRNELKSGQPQTKEFKNDALCWASGYEVVEGRRYKLTLERIGKDEQCDCRATASSWCDKTIPAPIGGFNVANQSWDVRVFLSAFILLRRDLSATWFQPIARIGASGNDEYLLIANGLADPYKLETTITARRTGELFLYLNDAALPVPSGGQYFYNNNKGTAKVTLELLDEKVPSEVNKALVQLVR